MLVEPADPYPYMYAHFPDEGALVMAVGSVGANPVPETDPTDPPTITALAPTTIMVDAETEVTVTGTNFGSDYKVWQDEQQMATTFVSSTSLTFLALASSAGIIDVTVHGGAGVSNGLQITVTDVAADPSAFNIDAIQAYVDAHPAIADEVLAAETARGTNARVTLLDWLRGFIAHRDEP